MYFYISLGVLRSLPWGPYGLAGRRFPECRWSWVRTPPRVQKFIFTFYYNGVKCEELFCKTNIKLSKLIKKLISSSLTTFNWNLEFCKLVIKTFYCKPFLVLNVWIAYSWVLLLFSLFSKLFINIHWLLYFPLEEEGKTNEQLVEERWKKLAGKHKHKGNVVHSDEEKSAASRSEDAAEDNLAGFGKKTSKKKLKQLRLYKELKDAEKAEKERRERVSERQKLVLLIFSGIGAEMEVSNYSIVFLSLVQWHSHGEQVLLRQVQSFCSRKGAFDRAPSLSCEAAQRSPIWRFRIFYTVLSI